MPVLLYIFTKRYEVMHNVQKDEKTFSAELKRKKKKGQLLLICLTEVRRRLTCDYFLK